MATIANNIPSIPLSPITKAWLVCQENLDQADEALKKAKKQTHPGVPVDVLRKLIEDVKVEQHQYDTLKRQMESLQTKSCFHWSPDSLAKQIAIVDCQLFSLVKLDKPLLCQFDIKSTHLDKLLDFHNYLTNNFAHQLIFWSDQVSSQSSQPLPKESMVSHLVQVAYALFHTYRDLSGFAAIMKALMLPEVRRLRSIWKRCSSRIKEMYTEMVAIMSTDHHYQAYHEALYQKLASLFFNHPSSNTTTNNNNESSSSTTKMVVIPWIQPHLISIHSIVTDYAAVGGGHATSQVLAASGLCHQDIELILSAPGLQKLAIVIALLEQCQYFITSSSSSSSSSLSSQLNNNTSSSMDILEDILKPWRQDFKSSNNNNDGVDSNNINKKKTRRQSVLSMPPKLSFDSNYSYNSSNTSISNHQHHQQQQNVQYLNNLYPGDLSVHHWLVSRVYLRKDQLVDESIQVQPLSPGEQLLCDYSPDDEAMMAITNKKQLEYIQQQQQQKQQKQQKDEDIDVKENNKVSEFKNISPRISATFAGWKSTTNLDLSLSLPHHEKNINNNNKDQSSSDNNNKKDNINNDNQGDDSGNNGGGDILNNDKPIISQELDDINMHQQQHHHQDISTTTETETTIELKTKTESSSSSPTSTSLDDLLVLTTRKPNILKRFTANQKDEINDKDNNISKEKSIEKNDDHLLLENNNKIEKEEEKEKEENNNISKNSVINNNNNINNNNTTINNDTTTTTTTTVTNITKFDTTIIKDDHHQQQQELISIEYPKTIENNNINHTNNNNNNINNIHDDDEKEKEENKNKKSKLSPTAPEFVPSFNHLTNNNQKKEEQQPLSLSTPSTPSNNNSNHQEINDNDSDSEQWNGYPTPPTLEEQQLKQSNHSGDDDEEEDDDDDNEVWTGYPGANGNNNHNGNGNNRPASIQSVISDEWKGYQAAKMEATWEMETALKVQLHEWQGYTLETLNEEDLQGQ